MNTLSTIAPIEPLTRRRALRTMLLGGATVALAACASTTNPTTGVVTYGIDPAVIATITSVVQAVANYIPTIESIAATAAGLFGPAYAAIVTAGSAAVNAIIAALTSLVPQIPVGSRVARRVGGILGTLQGYAKTPTGYVPIYRQ